METFHKISQEDLDIMLSRYLRNALVGSKEERQTFKKLIINYGSMLSRHLLIDMFIEVDNCVKNNDKYRDITAPSEDWREIREIMRDICNNN